MASGREGRNQGGGLLGHVSVLVLVQVNYRGSSHVAETAPFPTQQKHAQTLWRTFS